MIALSRAALSAHRKIFSGTIMRSEDAMDVIATALARYLAVYGVQDAGRGLTQITDSDLAMGEFKAGATRFEFRDTRYAFTELVVREIDLDRVLRAWLSEAAWPTT